MELEEKARLFHLFDPVLKAVSPAYRRFRTHRGREKGQVFGDRESGRAGRRFSFGVFGVSRSRRHREEEREQIVGLDTGGIFAVAYDHESG